MSPDTTQPSLSDQLEDLQTEDPRRYTLLKQHLTDLKYVLEHSDRNYAAAKQLYRIWDEPPFQPQTLGQLLSTMADLGVLGLQRDGSNHNQYDLTAYDRTRLQELARLLQGETNSTEPQVNQSADEQQ